MSMKFIERTEYVSHIKSEKLNNKLHWIPQKHQKFLWLYWASNVCDVQGRLLQLCNKKSTSTMEMIHKFEASIAAFYISCFWWNNGAPRGVFYSGTNVDSASICIVDNILITCCCTFVRCILIWLRGLSPSAAFGRSRRTRHFVSTLTACIEPNSRSETNSLWNEST